MVGQASDSVFKRWGWIPLVSLLSSSLVLLVGVGAYLLFMELSCPSDSRFDSHCYSDGLLLIEKAIFLLIAALMGGVWVLSGLQLLEAKRYEAAQWLALSAAVLVSIGVLLIDWHLWPLLLAFLVGLGLALLQARRLWGQ